MGRECHQRLSADNLLFAPTAATQIPTVNQINISQDPRRLSPGEISRAARRESFFKANTPAADLSPLFALAPYVRRRGA